MRNQSIQIFYKKLASSHQPGLQYNLMLKKQKVLILGIDPGSRSTGYGIIWTQGAEQGYIAHGQILAKGDSIHLRLQHIQQQLSQIITDYRPDEAAIEQIFTVNNAQSALKLGQARGAVLVAAAQHTLPLAEYSARTVKKAIVGYGAASKTQIQHMVALLLQLTQPLQADAADALAIALCHANHRRFTQSLPIKG